MDARERTGDTTETADRSVTLRCAFCATRNRVDMDRAAERPRCGECGRPFLLDRPVKVDGDDFRALVDDAGVPVLVDFYADWCGPCKVMAPVLDELAAERMGRVLVAKVDTDRAPRLSAELGIRGIPTLILYRDGREARRRTGAVSRAGLESVIGTE